MPTAIDLFDKARNHERLEQLQAARDHDLMPYFRVLEGPAGPVVEMEGQERIMLGSNNYLGLTGDERVKAAARDALEHFGTGLTGSRFLNGTLSLHLELERELADWMGTEDALVFTTGYLANTGTIGTLLGPGDTVICDSGDHASILDAVMMSRARIRPFRHNRLDKLETMLERSEGDGGGMLVVVDGVFDVEGEVDLRMGTFSKSLASCGGFIAGPADVIDFLRVQSRSFMFTAAAVPAAIGAAIGALRIIRSDEGPLLMAKVLDNARYLHDGLARLGYEVMEPIGMPDGSDVITPIVPVLVRDDWKAVFLWKALYDAGVYVNVAIHPAVQRGGALLRTSVMATHERDVLDQALGIFEKVQGEVENAAPPV